MRFEVRLVFVRFLTVCWSGVTLWMFLGGISRGTLWRALLGLGLLLGPFTAQAALKTYDLRVHNKTVNFTGRDVPHALAINNSIPAPTLYFGLGDVAVIKVTNDTNEPTTMHWHGLLVPWRQDGPQFTNTKVIAPQQSHTYKFTIRHTGTYWYHSHTALQEQRGLYGGIVVQDKAGRDHIMMSRQQASLKVREHQVPLAAPDYLLRAPMGENATLTKASIAAPMYTGEHPSEHYHPRVEMAANQSEQQSQHHQEKTGPIIHQVKTNTSTDHHHKNGHHHKDGHHESPHHDVTPSTTYDYDKVVIVSDWTNRLPMAVLHNIKKDGHWYNMKRGFFPSILGAIREGRFGAFLKSEWSRMGPMDLADVGYDAYLMNGMQKSRWPEVQPGQSVRLRFINAAASTYFYINIGQHRRFTVISKDGRPVVPVQVSEILLAIGETYDVIFQVPAGDRAYAVAATVQEGTAPSDPVHGVTQMILGSSSFVESTVHHPKAPMYGGMQHFKLGDHSGHDDPHKHAHESSHGEKTLTYEMLQSTEPTKFNDQLIRAQVIDLHLTGDMERYTWHINGKTFTEDKFIDIAENEVITFRFTNKTMMHHPMHLHGHFFRVLNGQGERAPLMHTLDVAPHETVDIEFHANEPGIWYLHCHNLYHMKMGMSRLVRYKSFDLPADLQADRDAYEKKVVKDNHAFWRGQITLNSVHAEAIVAVNKGRYDVIFDMAVDRWEMDHVEAEIIFRRYLTRLLSLDWGGTYESEAARAVLGVSYVLPGTVRVRTYLRHDKQLVVRLRKAVPITARLFADIHPEWKFFNKHTDYEFEIASTLGYRLSNQLALEIFHLYDKHKKSHAVGGGASYRF